MIELWMKSKSFGSQTYISEPSIFCTFHLHSSWKAVVPNKEVNLKQYNYLSLFSYFSARICRQGMLPFPPLWMRDRNLWTPLQIAEFFSWQTSDVNDRGITHTCQCVILKASVHKPAITVLAQAQHSESKEGWSNVQFCLSEEAQCKIIKGNSSHITAMSSAPQHFWVFQMATYAPESYLLLLPSCRI